MTNKKLTVASFFAGVGGIDLGFEQTDRFKVVYANEYNPEPVKTYEKNFDHKVDCRSICDVEGKDVPSVDVMVGGFPCQAFSIAGYRKGFEDEKGRGTLFFEMLRLIKDKQPKVVFLENVKNLVGHDNGKTFKIILDALKDNGYFVKYQVLNGMTHGNVPQNRERIYIVGFRNESQCEKFKFPEPIELTKQIKDVVDFNNKVDDKYYYTPAKYPRIFNTIDPNTLKDETIYQWRRIYLRENKSNVCPTLTANMGTGGHNVPLVKTKYGLRKLTPRECFLFQGYPLDYKFPDISDTSLYKQAGNSVVVPVIKRIADNILITF